MRGDNARVLIVGAGIAGPAEAPRAHVVPAWARASEALGEVS